MHVHIIRRNRDEEMEDFKKRCEGGRIKWEKK